MTTLRTSAENRLPSARGGAPSDGGAPVHAAAFASGGVLVASWWHRGRMRADRSGTAVAVGGIVVGSVAAIVLAALILTGVLGATLWFTVIAMILLAVSHGIALMSMRRRRD